MGQAPLGLRLMGLDRAQGFKRRCRNWSIAQKLAIIHAFTPTIQKIKRLTPGRLNDH